MKQSSEKFEHLVEIGLSHRGHRIDHIITRWLAQITSTCSLNDHFTVLHTSLGTEPLVRWPEIGMGCLAPGGKQDHQINGIFYWILRQQENQCSGESNHWLWPQSHFHGQSHYQGSRDRILLVTWPAQIRLGLGNVWWKEQGRRYLFLYLYMIEVWTRTRKISLTDFFNVFAS